jgi:peroxiredoxin
MFFRVVFLASLMGFFIFVPAMAQEPEAAPAAPEAATEPLIAPDPAPEARPAPVIDEKAGEVLEHFQSYMAGLDAYSFEAVIAATVTREGESQDGQIILNLARQKADSIRIEAIAEGSEAVIGATEGEAYIYVPELKEYMTAPTPPDLGVLVTSAAAGTLQLGSTFVAELTAPQPYARLVENATTISYVGEEELDAQTYHRLHFVDPRLSYDLWIATGDQPLLYKAVPDLQAMIEAQGEEGEIEMTTHIRAWNTAPEFAEGFFAFEAPEGVKKVDKLAEAQEATKDGPHPLLGKPAPAFTLPLLDGTEISLADHAGKDIVILDFWATWCGPCRNLMPIISDVVADYKDKNVVLYAVNMRENEERIKGFLETLGLDVAVAMDKEGTVATLYEVEYIPQSVIIGKDGTVQVVHVGTAPSIETELRAELDALIEGKDLAAQALEAPAAPVAPVAPEQSVETEPAE